MMLGELPFVGLAYQSKDIVFTNTLSTLANSTLIIFIFKNVSKFTSSKSRNIVKENSEYLGIFHLFEMNFSKLINYLTNMC
jgi:hypothetical protein